MHIQNSKTNFRTILLVATTPTPEPSAPTAKPTTDKPAGNSNNRFILYNISSNFVNIATHIYHSKIIRRIALLETTTPTPKPTTPNTTVKPTTEKPAGNSINRYFV